jgi:hypothetical protein
MHKEISIAKFWLSIGMSKQIGLGFVVNKYFLSVDLGPFYITVEF